VATELETPEGTEDTIFFDETEESIPIEKKGFKRDGSPRWIIRRDWHNKGGKKQGEFRGGNNNRELAIEVQDDPLVNTLADEPFAFDIASKSQEKQRFKDVVLAFSDMWNNTGRMAGMEEIDVMGIKGLGDKKTRLKFLDIAKKIKLYKERGDRPALPQKPSILEKELEDFEEQQEVRDWLRKTKFKDIGYTGDLKKALKILDMSPASILAGNPKDPKTQFQNKEFDDNDYLVWLTDKMTKEKTWTAKNGEKWNLKDWAFAPMGRPFISGADNKHSSEGEKIAQRKKSTSLKNSEGQWKKFKIALKHFLATHKRISGARLVGTVFAIPTPVLKYATLKMTGKEIESTQICLARTGENPTPLKFTQESVSVKETGEYDAEGTYVKHAREGLAKINEFDTTLADWHDAYMYFMVAMDVGWRANEGLTATVGSPDEDPKSTGVWIDNKSDNLPQGIMNIKFLTRKTWGLDPPRFSHTEFILNPITRQMVEDKIRKVKEGISKFGEKGWTDDKVFQVYGIKRWKYVDGKEIAVQENEHALIGHDGKYIKFETMKFPTKHKLTKKELREQREAKKTIEFLEPTDLATFNLHGIMREAIIDSGVNTDATVVNEKTGETVKLGQYWLRDTMHSLRHVFAQVWLLKSNFNFSFVSKKGHWGASKILEDAYGGVDDTEFFLQSLTFNNVDMLEQEKKKKISMDEQIKKTLAAQNYVDPVTKVKGSKQI